MTSPADWIVLIFLMLLSIEALYRYGLEIGLYK